MEDETAPVQTLELQADVLFSASVGPPRQDHAIWLAGRATAARRRIRGLVTST
jgi:hypothetical protein